MTYSINAFFDTQIHKDLGSLLYTIKLSSFGDLEPWVGEAVSHQSFNQTVYGRFFLFLSS